MNLASKYAPVTGVKSLDLKYLALDPKFSVIEEYSRFTPTRINMCSIGNGVENIQLVSFLYSNSATLNFANLILILEIPNPY